MSGRGSRAGRSIGFQWGSVVISCGAGSSGSKTGPPPFLVAGAVPAALAAVTAADRPRLSRQLDVLTGRLIAGLEDIRHRDGSAVINIHGPRTTGDRGAVVAFTVEDARGGVIPFWKVEDAARKAGLAVRGGCFCNPGCAEQAFGLDPAVAQPCLDTLGEDFTIPLFAECLGGGPVGAVRISFGLGSVRADVDRALAMLRGYSNC